ncbi:hypothetical protein JCM14036_35540 [Desulfotomaculum defluvii]
MDFQKPLRNLATVNIKKVKTIAKEKLVNGVIGEFVGIINFMMVGIRVKAISRSITAITREVNKLFILAKSPVLLNNIKKTPPTKTAE